MTSDLPGDLGSGEPGLDQLLSMLTSGPAADELAGEQEALAMFRANIHSPAPATAQIPAVAPPGAAAPPGVIARPGGRRTRPMRQRRAPGHPLRFRLTAGAMAAALVGGLAAAAYMAVLPAPVQHIAYQAFHIFGVPDSHHTRAGGTLPETTSSRPSRPQPSGSPAPSHPGHSVPGSPAPSRSATPRTSPRSPSPSPSPSSATAGTATVTATAAASQIPAGSTATIDGQLMRAGKALSGVTVRLWERSPGHLAWQLAGRASTGAQGTVAIAVADLITNARFRLTDPDGPASSPVVVTVVPQITVTLTLGSRGVKDYLDVSTQFAHRRDTVVLQGFQDGTWVALREHVLNAAGKTVFVLGARKMQGMELQVVLLATRRHAEAVSSSVTVPPPA